MEELYAAAVKVAHDKKKTFEKIMSSKCFDIHLSKEEMSDPVIKSMLMKAKAMGGGFDIMKKVVKKQRTTKGDNKKQAKSEWDTKVKAPFLDKKECGRNELLKVFSDIMVMHKKEDLRLPSPIFEFADISLDIP